MASPLEWNTAKPALVPTSIKQYMASPLEWNTAKPALVTTSIKQYMATTDELFQQCDMFAFSFYHLH